ncbi:hypothetical protein GCM10008931_03140 [Oceanobacillus oncorhynchi subsp. oncorhynchi]
MGRVTAATVLIDRVIAGLNVVRLMNFINFDTDSNKTYLAEEKHVDSYGKAQCEDPAEKSGLLFSRRLSASPWKA